MEHCVLIFKGFGQLRRIANIPGNNRYVGMIRQMAVEYAEQNIRFNAISPGAIATELGVNTDKLEPGFAAEPEPDAANGSSEPAPRPRLLAAGKAEDIANAALFLASDEAAYISGQNLVVDGVMTCRAGR